MRQIANVLQTVVPSFSLGFARKLYDRLPPVLRYGKEFQVASNFLERSQYWTATEHRIYQLQRLKILVTHAYKNIPFYRDLYDQYGVDLNEIRQLEDIQKLPTISKDDIKENLNSMKAEGFSASKFQYHTTGGSTGKPIGLYWEADRTVPLEQAFINRQWGWMGFNARRDRYIILRGTPLSKGNFYEISNNQLRLSTYDLTSNIIDKCIDIIKRFQPVALYAYPSAAFIFAQNILGISSAHFPTLKLVLCGSENLQSWQRSTIAKAFKCKIFSWYGHSEYAALGGECEYSTDYHFFSEYGITEFLNTEGKWSNVGETSEIVATGFNNYAMPLIRYRTEDLAQLSQVRQCKCGRSYPLVSMIEGRRQEMIIGKLGNLISMTAINMHTDVFDNIQQFQFYQDSPGEVIMRIVRRSGFTPEDEKKILTQLSEKLRGHVNLVLEYVDIIPTSPRGKVGFLIQRLPIDSFERKHLSNKME